MTLVEDLVCLAKPTFLAALFCFFASRDQLSIAAECLTDVLFRGALVTQEQADKPIKITLIELRKTGCNVCRCSVDFRVFFEDGRRLDAPQLSGSQFGCEMHRLELIEKSLERGGASG